MIERVDCVLLNDAEIRELTGKPSLMAAAGRSSRWARRQ